MTSAKIRGSAFMASLPPGGDPHAIEAREEIVLDAVRRGIALPISWKPVHSEFNGHQATIYVACDTLRFGVPGPNADPDDWDWVRVAVTPTTAQRIADQLGVLLPTDKILDLVHAQADVRLHPHIQSPVTATTKGMLEHHAAIEAERAGRPGLLSTIGKDWILDNELFPTPWGTIPPHPFGWDGAVNYGWHTEGPVTSDGPYMGQPGVILWQTKGYRHNRGHVDYSQWIPRYVRPDMLVDGRRMRTADVMMSPTLSGLVSYEGPLRGVRYPDKPQNRTASRGLEGGAAPEAGAPGDPFAELGAGAPEAGSADSANDPGSAIRKAHAAFIAYIHRSDPDYRAWVNGIGITLAGLHDILRRPHTREALDALRATAEDAIHVGYLPGRLPEVLVPFAKGERFQGFVVEVEEQAMAYAQPAPAGGTDAGLSEAGAPGDPFATLDAGETGAEAVSKDLDLGGYTFQFSNGFPDATFLGLHFSGLCGGVASAVLDNFFTKTPAPTRTTTPSTQEPLGAYIKARQIDSLFGWHLARFASMMANPSDEAIARQTAVSFQELRDAVDAGKPVLLGLIPSPWTLNPAEATGAHQVVATGYSVGEDGTRTVFIWDPNRPRTVGENLRQAPGALHWIEAAARPYRKIDWRGFFVESGYTPKRPPRDEGAELVASNDAGFAESDAGDALDTVQGWVHEAAPTWLDDARAAQRDYLADSWVNGTVIGDFLKLPQPKKPSAVPEAGPLFENYGTPKPLVPEAGEPSEKAPEPSRALRWIQRLTETSLNPEVAYAKLREAGLLGPPRPPPPKGIVATWSPELQQWIEWDGHEWLRTFDVPQSQEGARPLTEDPKVPESRPLVLQKPGEAGDPLTDAFAAVSTAFRMIESGERGHPALLLQAAKEALRAQLGWPPWLRGVGIGLDDAGGNLMVFVQRLTPEVRAAIPATIAAPGSSTQIPVRVEAVGDVVAYGVDAGTIGPLLARERAVGLLRQLAKREGADEDAGAPSALSELATPPSSPVRARLYSGEAGAPCLVLVHGLGKAGIDDPRLVRLARALASAGLTVLTPEIPAIARGRLAPSAVDTIGDAVAQVAEITGQRVGLVGLSFAGGLSLLAAADPRFSDAIGFVVAIGAHHDLAQVARFCVTGRVALPDGGAERRAPDPAGRRLLAQVLASGTDAGADELLAAVGHAAEALAAVSPRGRLGGIEAPVFLLHGADDALIPAAESARIAREIPPGVLREVLVTRALSHVDVGEAGAAAGADGLVDFLAGVLEEADGLQVDPSDEAGDVDLGGMLGSGVAAVAGAAGGNRVADEAKVGAGVGALVGTAAEFVPVVGPFIHAFAAAIGAAIGAISGALRDKFNATQLQAVMWLALLQVCPALLFSGIDTIRVGSKNAAELAARLVRWFNLIGQVVPNPGPEMCNPSNLGCNNAYMRAVDPRFPQTNPRHTEGIRRQCLRTGRCPPDIRTPEAAKVVLALLRHGIRKSGILSWDEIPPYLPAIRANLRLVRALAGETGPDAHLAGLFGGDVTPLPPRRAPARRRASRPAPPPPHRGPPRPPPIAPGDPFADLGAPGAPAHAPEEHSMDQHAPAPGDPFRDVGDAGAPIGVAPETALEQLVAQLDRRYPYRGKGPMDGVEDDVLRITNDPGRTSGGRRTGPDIAALNARICADPRTLHTQRITDRAGARYLAITVRPAALRDTAAWDLEVSADAGGPVAAPGTWNYFREDLTKPAAPILLGTGIRDTQRADATTRENWADFPGPVLIWRERADIPGPRVLVLNTTPRRWTYTRWRRDERFPLYLERVLLAGVPESDVDRIDLQVQADERAKGDLGVWVERTPSDDPLAHLSVWDTEQGGMPKPGSGAYGMAPGGPKRSETAGLDDAGAPETVDDPSAFLGGSVISLWVPRSASSDTARWEDVARTKPGRRGALLARDLGGYLVGLGLTGLVEEPAFGVVVSRDPSERGMLLLAKRPRGKVMGEWFPAGTAPHWPRWAVDARQAPPPRFAAYQGDADIFANGSIASLWDRSAAHWDDLVESRPRGPFDLGQEIAFYLVREIAERGKITGLGRWIQRDPRGWTGTALVACQPGEKPRVEQFPTGSAPTWARLLSAGETGEAGAPPGPTEREITREVAANLALWCRLWPVACDPEDFGTQADVTGPWTPRGASALRCFQGWYNAVRAASVLPVSGIRDPASTAALAAWAARAGETTGDTGDVFWPFDGETAERLRQQQWDYLRGTWVRDTPLGSFLKLDRPDGPPPATPSPGPLRLVPEGPASPGQVERARAAAARVATGAASGAGGLRRAPEAAGPGDITREDLDGLYPEAQGLRRTDLQRWLHRWTGGLLGEAGAPEATAPGDPFAGLDPEAWSAR